MLNKESVCFFAFSVTGMLIGLVNVHFLAAYFSVHEFGKFQLVQTYIGVLAIFGLTGYDISLQKKLYQQKDAYARYVITRILPFSAIAVLCVAGIISLFHFEHRNLLLLALSIVLVTLFDKSTAIFNGKLNFRAIRYWDVGTRLVMLATTLVALRLQLRFRVFMLCFAALSTAAVIARLSYAFKTLSVPSAAQLSREERQQFNKEALHSSFSAAFSIFSRWTERIILGIIDPATLAVFSIAQLFPRTLKDNIKTLLTPVLDTWASRGEKVSREQIARHKGTLLLMGTVAFAGITTITLIVVPRFFEKYEQSIPFSIILSLTLSIGFLEMGMANSLALTNGTKAFNNINIASNTVKLLLSAVLVPLCGVNGAVTAVLIHEIVRFGMFYHQFTAREAVLVQSEQTLLSQGD